MNRMGIDVGKIKAIVHVVAQVGVEYVYKDGNFVLKKTYSNFETAFPSQVFRSVYLFKKPVIK